MNGRTPGQTREFRGKRWHMSNYFRNIDVISAGGGSPQARLSDPDIIRNPQDEVCPICGGIKCWDSESCEECFKKEKSHV